MEVKDGNSLEGGIEGSLDSFNELVKEMTSKQQDIKAFAFKTKAMVAQHFEISPDIISHSVERLARQCPKKEK
ncbi:putative galacturonosyltransferase 15-like protein [Corchorus olitorius]|uniref:Galacturonosyltransferase 15-like protein n=1 Tax=Corchorus olitorius TaxID=93759 RepID=A0A1R3GRT6_9ROSI|nr:putative galacturonosyltransferase 15-like protein [Corchorus olitorius]